MSIASERPTLMKLVLADGQSLVRAGIRMLLQSEGQAEVVGEAGDGQELLALIAKLRPRAALVELDLPVVNGLDVLAQARRHYPEVAVLLLAARPEPGQVRSALRQGAAGFLTKQAEPQELGLALRSIEKRQTYISPAVSNLLLDRRDQTRIEDAAILTHRQRQVLTLIGKGKSTKEIAALLGVSVKTVETHRARLMQSLGLYGTNALMRTALRWGLDTHEH
ncbi:LuxR family two component transcriptional regulator [Panacagrimonas perspica]|uniref:LuxR family two component transcriptional regulator n=2 Tax=Panacagrimonas perspica TaxID=381431 RepID=A0A4R7PBX5_9GAMM|nr:LuxR family two component transcriptional regulator [Panacagrimonas perspica]